MADGRELERALAEAFGRRLLVRQRLVVAVESRRGRRGTAALRAHLDRDGGPAFTRSEAEERLLALVRAAGLPAPRTNARHGRYEIDFLWPEHRLAVEVDGYAYHSSRAAFERDRLRDADLGAAGLRVVLITWRQIVDAPAAVVARLATALARVP